MELEFRWNEWNVNHIGKHGVKPEQAEYVVTGARAPFPQEIDRGKFLVMGQDENGRYLRVIYVADPDATAFVIHAMPLSDRDKKRYRRRLR
jgi:uncharacterized DUF497 family protein